MIPLSLYGMNCWGRGGSGRVCFAKSQDGQFAVLLTVLAVLPCEVLHEGYSCAEWYTASSIMQDPAASILRVGQLFAEGAVNTLVVRLNTRLYDITPLNQVISKPCHFASLPGD